MTVNKLHGHIINKKNENDLNTATFHQHLYYKGMSF